MKNKIALNFKTALTTKQLSRLIGGGGTSPGMIEGAGTGTTLGSTTYSIKNPNERSDQDSNGTIVTP